MLSGEVLKWSWASEVVCTFEVDNESSPNFIEYLVANWVIETVYHRFEIQFCDQEGRVVEVELWTLGTRAA